MKQQTKKAFLRLKELRDAAQKNLFERAQLAATVMADADWIAELHGDYDVAAESVGSEFFPDVCGFLPLATIVAIVTRFPDEAVWREHRYNLTAMRALFDEARAAERGDEARPTRQTAKRADVEERDKRIADLTYELKRDRELLAARESELDVLRRQMAELREENALLRGRVHELERLTKRELIGA